MLNRREFAAQGDDGGSDGGELDHHALARPALPVERPLGLNDDAQDAAGAACGGFRFQGSEGAAPGGIQPAREITALDVLPGTRDLLLNALVVLLVVHADAQGDADGAITGRREREVVLAGERACEGPTVRPRRTAADRRPQNRMLPKLFGQRVVRGVDAVTPDAPSRWACFSSLS